MFPFVGCHANNKKKNNIDAHKFVADSCQSNLKFILVSIQM